VAEAVDAAACASAQHAPATAAARPAPIRAAHQAAIPAVPDAPAARDRTRAAVGLIFAVHGVVTGTYASRLPWIASHIHASPGVLGAAMITPTIGALVAMPRTGALVHRLGGRTGMRVLLAAWTLALILPAFAPNALVLAAFLFVFGAAAGSADVAMNAHAVRAERRAGKSIMSGMHGLWSVGGIAGSGLGGLCAAAHVAAPAEFLATALALTVLGFGACHWLGPDQRPAGSALRSWTGPRGRSDPTPGADATGAAAGSPDEDLAAEIRPPRYALPSRALLGIGLVGFCGIFGEGAGTDWSAVYLTHVAHASAAIAAFCVTGFASTMALGRLSGDLVVRRIGPVRTVRAGGVLAVLGAVTVVLARDAPMGIAGFAALGLGIATVVPLAIAASGRTTENADAAVAGITTITYTAGLLAGPSVGLLGSAVSLPFSFCVVAALTAGIALSAHALRPAEPPPGLNPG
jgi:predicted MFS family arabinose efflux permease